MTKTTISINFTPKVANDLTIDGFTLDNVEIDCTNEKFMIIKMNRKNFISYGTRSITSSQKRGKSDRYANSMS